MEPVWSFLSLDAQQYLRDGLLELRARGEKIERVTGNCATHDTVSEGSYLYRLSFFHRPVSQLISEWVESVFQS